ncbi:MAG: CPBP family intramembrane metalloprotease [Clostridia bacterium]|nr:CPBP family intramembrane metalloprotease [Clostridia bacterium]
MSKEKRLNVITIASLIAIAIISILGILNIENLTSIGLIIGLVMYFVTKSQKESFKIKSIPKAFCDIKTDILMVMPIVSAFLSTFLAKYICPEYANHIAERTSFVPSEVLMLIPTLLIAALGEEIAMRGFMQNKLTKYISFVPALIITSILFAMCHVSQGSIAVVLYDLVFIFVDSIFYGLIFKRTNNVCVSTISHFIANLLSVLVFL